MYHITSGIIFTTFHVFTILDILQYCIQHTYRGEASYSTRFDSGQVQLEGIEPSSPTRNTWGALPLSYNKHRIASTDTTGTSHKPEVIFTV